MNQRKIVNFMGKYCEKGKQTPTNLVVAVYKYIIVHCTYRLCRRTFTFSTKKQHENVQKPKKSGFFDVFEALLFFQKKVNLHEKLSFFGSLLSGGD